MPNPIIPTLQTAVGPRTSKGADLVFGNKQRIDKVLLALGNEIEPLKI